MNDPPRERGPKTVTCENEVDKTGKHTGGQIFLGVQMPLWIPVKHGWKFITEEKTTIRPTKHRLPAWSKLRFHQNRAAAEWGFTYATSDLNA